MARNVQYTSTWCIILFINKHINQRLIVILIPLLLSILLPMGLSGNEASWWRDAWEAVCKWVSWMLCWKFKLSEGSILRKLKNVISIEFPKFATFLMLSQLDLHLDGLELQSTEGASGADLRLCPRFNSLFATTTLKWIMSIRVKYNYFIFQRSNLQLLLAIPLPTDASLAAFRSRAMWDFKPLPPPIWKWQTISMPGINWSSKTSFHRSQ